MMALGGSSSGIGGSSSLSSNLSASAPPFTIDQFSSNPNSNPVLHYADASYVAPFGHTWQYTSTPSAPQSNQPEVGGNSARTSSGEYSFLGSGSVNPSSTQWPAIGPCDASSMGGYYVPEARPYHSPIMYPVVSGESSSLSLSQPMYDQSSIHVASRGDYSEHLPGVGYTPHWQGTWKGELSRGNQIGSGGGFLNEKLNESSPFVYKNYINEGSDIQSGDASRGDSGILCGLSTDGVQTASHAGSFHRGIPDGKSLFSKNHGDDLYANPIDSTEKNRSPKSFNITNIDGRSKSSNMLGVDGESLYSQNVGHFNPSGTQFPGPSLSFPEFSPLGTFQESTKNNQMTYGSQESSIQPRVSFVNDPISPMKPDCTVVKKSPASKTSAARDTDKIVGNRIASNCGSKLWDIPYMSEEKGYFMSTRPESTEGSCYTNKTDKEGNYWNFIASTSKGEVPTNSQLEDSVDFVLSNRPAPQVTDSNVSYDFSPSFDYVQSYKYTEDALENHVLALDSPCWKGSQVSYSSHNNFTESLPGIQFLKDLDGCLDIPGNHIGPTIVASRDLSIGNANFRTGCAAKDELPAQSSISESSCAAKEINPDPSAKDLTNCPYSGSSKDGQFLNDSDNHRKEPNLSNIFLGNETRYSCSNQCNMEKGFAPVEVNLHAGIQDGVTSCNEAADAGSVAYHAAENVLYSPPAQEVFEENHQSSVKEVAQIVDISALVKAIHSISEVLQSHCPADSCVLTEQNQESLKHVIRNLDACLPKKVVDSSPVSEFMVPLQSTSISTGDRGDLGKAKGATQPHQNYQATTASSGELGHPKIHNDKINYCDYGRQAGCLPYFLPSEQNKRISSDDKMVQAIKKVLEENFNFEEEKQSQVLLFKNLWLEAEARLCSISYRAHFDHMRIQMDGYKLNKGKGSAADADKDSISKDSPRVEDASLTSFLTKNGPLLEGRITNQSSSSIDTIADNVDTSLFPRFNASSLHSDGFSPDERQRSAIPRKTEGGFESVITPDAVGHVGDFGDEVLARLAILKQRDDKLNEVPQQLNVLDTNKSGRQSGSSSSTSISEFQVNHAEATMLARLNILKQRDDKPNEVQQQSNVHDTDNLEFHVNHAEAAMLARLNVLKQRDDKPNEVQQQPNVRDTNNLEFHVNHAEATMLARLNILKQRDDKPNEVQEQPNVHDTNNLDPQPGSTIGTSDPESQVNSAEAAALARLNILKREIRSSADEHQNDDTRKAELDSFILGNRYESLKDFSEGAVNDQVIESGRNSNQNNSSGSHDSSSSEWEHIQSEDISWQKG